MPIAVIARPGYDDAAHAAVAMGWLGRFVRPASHKTQWTDWRPPALVHLRFRPDPRSATLLRQADPHWYRDLPGRALRDPVTRLLISIKELHCPSPTQSTIHRTTPLLFQPLMTLSPSHPPTPK